MPVTSVFRRAEAVSLAPASIYVISAEEIRRSGAATLAEALRLAPNLHVARVDARTYAISARGFNNAIGNKLLVLIDGRTVYSPLFSGVFWDQQDVMLEDVERIEVISGPGGTQWGANAVNGVINVITHSASETRGALAAATVGRSEDSGVARIGASFAGGAMRFYAKAIEHAGMELASGAVGIDAWRRWQAGLRADWSGPGHVLALIGEAYDGEAKNGNALGTPSFSGASLTARWSAQAADGSETRLQAYVDHTERDQVVVFRDRTRVYDVEAQYGVRWGAHQVMLGGGTRWANNRTATSTLVRFIPAEKNLRWSNLFAQDTVELVPGVRGTAGIRFEHNVYTGWEVLPGVRVAWTKSERELVWGRVSRAVRAPARLDREFFFPGTPPFAINGGPDFESEVATVAELGYRVSPIPAATFTATVFYGYYDKLRSGQPAPAVIQNMIEGDVSGIEMWGLYQPTPWLRLTAGATLLEKDLRLKAGSTDPTGPVALGNDPRHQWMLRASMSPHADVDVDVLIRGVGSLPAPRVPGYTAVDARIGWSLGGGVDVSVGVRNASDPGHTEFGAAATAGQVPRSVYLRLSWKL